MIARAGLPVLIALAAVALVTVTQLQRANTLYHNGHWASGKLELQLGVTGAASFLVTRTPLRGNHLNPGDWHGYQEVLYADPVSLRSLDVRFVIDDESYLTFLMRRTATGFEGVRLSRNGHFPSACLQGDADGAFTSMVRLHHDPIDDDPHSVELAWEGTALVVRLDGRQIGRCTGTDPHVGPARFGVRGAQARHSWIDDVVAVPLSGPPIRETFANRRGAGRIFAVWATVAGAVLLAAWAAARRSRTPGGPAAAALLASLVLLVVAALVWAVDTLYFAKLHPLRIDFTPYGFTDTIEDAAQVEARVRDIATHPKPPDTARVLFVGSSQTWGAGARLRDQAWVAQLGRRLDAAAPAPWHVEVLSLGISSYVGAQAVDATERYGFAWSPDTIVVDLSYNDADDAAFERALEKFVDLARAHGVRLVFVPEPNATEKPDATVALLEKQTVMRRVAQERGIPVVEVKSFLDERADTGFLWWDNVHLTSFGQQLLAERLFEARAVLLPSLFGGGEAPAR